MWKEGNLAIPKRGGYETACYWVKAYDEPSEEYGLDGGRISKISIRMNGKWVVNYDRGWDIKPDTKEARKALQILLEKYN